MFRAYARRSFFVGGLHPEVSREELLEYLSGFVTVDEIDIKMDAATGKKTVRVHRLGIRSVFARFLA